MADTKLSALGALTGADSASGDLFYVDDVSATTSKSITRAELAIGMNATQAEQETATATNKLVSPAVQHSHPSAVKAWGLITPATTVTVSYPSAGVSVTNPSSGLYVVTHGVTFSSANYAVVISIGNTEAVLAWAITARDATTFTVQFRHTSTQVLTAPTTFSYSCMGDI